MVELRPLEQASGIELVLLDVDGVLTDGRLYYGASGEMLKVFHVHDGLGIRLLEQSGIAVGIITARESAALTARLAELRLSHIRCGRGDKLCAYEELRRELALRDEQIAYVGDDIIDLPVLRRVGLACAVANAHPLVKAEAHFITVAHGGRGAVREVADLVLTAQGKLEAACRAYLTQHQGN